MIGRLEGTIIEKRAPDLLIDVNGVGYELQLPMTSFYDLPDIGGHAVIFTHFVVREDAQSLYGFSRRKERDLFRILLKANGVGPKLGLGILSGMNSNQFVQCVMNDEVSSLVKLPGVGKKTAERLLIEMRDRLKSWQQETPYTDNAAVGNIDTDTFVTIVDPADDAIAALESLGYPRAQAQKMVKDVKTEGASSEQLIKDALKAML